MRTRFVLCFIGHGVSKMLDQRGAYNTAIPVYGTGESHEFSGNFRYEEFLQLLGSGPISYLWRIVFS